MARTTTPRTGPAKKSNTSRSSRGVVATQRGAAPRAAVQSKQDLRDRIEKLERANVNLRAKNRAGTEAARAAAERIDALEEELAGLREARPALSPDPEPQKAASRGRSAVAPGRQAGKGPAEADKRPARGLREAAPALEQEPVEAASAGPEVRAKRRQPAASRRRKDVGGSDHDPGDAVPPGVAPLDPSPMDAEAEAAKRSLDEHLGGS